MIFWLENLSKTLKIKYNFLIVNKTNLNKGYCDYLELI